MAWHDLRDYLKFLEQNNDLLVINEEVSAEYEIVALTRETSDVQGPALLFTNVKGYEYPVLSGLFAAERRVANSFNVEPKDFINYYMEKEKDVIETKMVEQA